MDMATKLTKSFAEFVGGRGFLIANEGKISQQPGEDYKLARQIFRNKRVLLPFLTKLAVVAEGQTTVNMPRQMCRGHSVVAAVAVAAVRGAGIAARPESAPYQNAGCLCRSICC